MSIGNENWTWLGLWLWLGFRVRFRLWPKCLSSSSACFLVRAQGQVVYGQALDIRYHRHYSTSWPKPKTILATFELFLPLCLLRFSFHFLCADLWICMHFADEVLWKVHGYWIYLILILLSERCFSPPFLPLFSFVDLPLFRYYDIATWRLLQVVYANNFLPPQIDFVLVEVEISAKSQYLNRASNLNFKILLVFVFKILRGFLFNL